MEVAAWVPSIVEIAAALILAGLGWFARSLRDVRRTISRLRDKVDAREDDLEARLVRCESVDADAAIERIGKAEERVSRLEAAQITHEDLGRVYRRLDKVVDAVSAMGQGLGSSVAEVKGALESTRGQVALVCQHLMERGGK